MVTKIQGSICLNTCYKYHQKSHVTHVVNHVINHALTFHEEKYFQFIH